MNDADVKALAEAFKLGKESIVGFRQIFLPSPNDSAPAWFHYEWDRILREETRHFAVEAFRESAKTALVIRAHILYRLVYPSEEYNYIVIVKANQREASKKLKEISAVYMNNPVFRGNLVRVKEQTERCFHVDVKDDTGKVVSVRIEAFGKGGALRGLEFAENRPKLIVVDDCEDIQDCTETILDADWEWFLSDIYFLGKTSRIFMIGNNLSERCLIERVISGANELGFQTMRVPVLNPEGKSNWPEYWPTEKVIEERERWTKLGMLNIWFREKMCLSMSPDDQIFKKENFKYYDPTVLDRDGWSVYTTVDLAISEKETADYTVVCTVAVSPENHWFILDIQFGRWNPGKTMDKIFEAVHKYRPLFVGIEKVAYQASLQFFLEKEMPMRNIFFVIKPLVADKKKELRIQNLQPRFIAGTVWFAQGASWLAELETQLLSFPKGIFDDLPDALAYIEQIAIPPSGTWGSTDHKSIPFAGAM